MEKLGRGVNVDGPLTVGETSRVEREQGRRNLTVSEAEAPVVVQASPRKYFCQFTASVDFGLSDCGQAANQGQDAGGLHPRACWRQNLSKIERPGQTTLLHPEIKYDANNLPATVVSSLTSMVPITFNSYFCLAYSPAFSFNDWQAPLILHQEAMSLNSKMFFLQSANR